MTRCVLTMDVDGWVPQNVTESQMAAAERWGADYRVIDECKDKHKVFVVKHDVIRSMKHDRVLGPMWLPCPRAPRGNSTGSALRPGGRARCGLMSNTWPGSDGVANPRPWIGGGSCWNLSNGELPNAMDRIGNGTER